MSYVPANTDAEASLSSSSKDRSIGLDVCLSVAIALGTILRIAWVGKRELWYDEVLSVLFASGQKNAYAPPINTPFKIQDISQLITGPSVRGLSSVETVKDVLKGTLGDPHPPLFYLAGHGWTRIFGTSETALRALMVLISLLALVVSYHLGRKVLGRRGGLIFAALLSLNPFFLAHSLNLRMYAPMVLWVLVSGWCLSALIEVNKEPTQNHKTRHIKKWMWRGGVALSLAAGLLTQYLFAYWLCSLVALALYLDRNRWSQYALTIGTGVLLFIPWGLWGTRQQIHNRRDVLDQISSAYGPLESALRHGKDIAQTLGNHLLLGHSTTNMLPFGEDIKPTAVAVGCGVIGFLAVCIVGLYRRRQYRVLMICVLMGLLPLAAALAVDVAAGTFTLGFGWGRSIIVALPGCLLLVAAWLELGSGRSRTAMTGLLLAVYLGVNVVDFGGRDRQMFYTIDAYLPQSDEPSLVVINSQAWGHVLRLAYYLKDSANTEVLATDAADGPTALAAALSAQDYSRVLWLRSNDPVWGVTDGDAEVDVAAFADETESLLNEHYAAGTKRGIPAKQMLEGTMDLDSFTLQVYE